MSEIPLEFDPAAISEKLADLTEMLCDLDYQARDQDTLDDPLKSMEVAGQVAAVVFGLPMAAMPTVVMFIISQLNHARNMAGAVMAGCGDHSAKITDVATQLTAQDADPRLMFELLDVATVLRKVSQDSPFTLCDHEECA